MNCQNHDTACVNKARAEAVAREPSSSDVCYPNGKRMESYEILQNFGSDQLRLTVDCIVEATNYINNVNWEIRQAEKRKEAFIEVALMVVIAAVILVPLYYVAKGSMRRLIKWSNKE